MLISKEMSGAIEAFQYQIVVCSECKLWMQLQHNYLEAFYGWSSTWEMSIRTSYCYFTSVKTSLLMHLNSATYLYIKHISAFPLFYGAAVLMPFSAFSEYINCIYMKTLLPNERHLNCLRKCNPLQHYRIM